MKTRFLVSAKAFRNQLKQILLLASAESETIGFNISTDSVESGGFYLGSHSKAPGYFDIDIDSIERMIKVLKHIKEQPISIEIHDGERFTLTCAVI